MRKWTEAWKPILTSTEQYLIISISYSIYDTFIHDLSTACVAFKTKLCKGIGVSNLNWSIMKHFSIPSYLHEIHYKRNAAIAIKCENSEIFANHPAFAEAVCYCVWAMRIEQHSWPLLFTQAVLFKCYLHGISKLLAI